MTDLERFFLGLVEAGALTVDKQGVVVNTITKHRIGSFNKQKGWVVVAQVDATGKLQYILLHRLVWLVYNGPVPDKARVVPKDKNFLNAALDNLELSSKAIRDQIKAEARAVVKKPFFTKLLKPVRVFVRVPRPKKPKPIPVKKDKSERDNVTLNLEHVVRIRKEYRAGVDTKILADRYHVGLNTIRMAADGSTWSECTEPVVTRAQRLAISEKLRDAKKIERKKDVFEKRLQAARVVVAKQVARARIRSVCAYKNDLPKPKTSTQNKIPQEVKPNIVETQPPKEVKIYRGRLAMLNNW